VEEQYVQSVMVMVYLTIKLQGEKDPVHKDCKYCDNRGEISLDGKKIEKYLNYSRMMQ
jgi:hypothetical protein